jgi:hypothetical protein
MVGCVRLAVLVFLHLFNSPWLSQLQARHSTRRVSGHLTVLIKAEDSCVLANGVRTIGCPGRPALS